MEDYSLLDSSCSCWTGHPPCSFCVDTCECESCTDRVYSEEVRPDYDYGLICIDCAWELEEQKNKYSLLDAAQDIFTGLGLLAYVATINDLLTWAADTLAKQL